MLSEHEYAPPAVSAAANPACGAVPPSLAVELVRDFCAAAFSVPASDIGAPTRRQADTARARQTAMYLAHVVFSVPLSAVARHFGRDRTTAEHACRLVEDSRDDPVIDAHLDAIELALAATAARRLAPLSVRR
jgi:chromosomal replication initiation ATPase DnaA